jgi:zinc/manganese transport system substrate-binding protein
MMRFFRSLTILLALSCAPAASAAINVFACEPEWAALAKELGGTDVTVFAATTALQDPHQIQARPSLIARLREADLLVCTGAELEVGWLPVLLRQAANPRVQPGEPGYFEAWEQVRLLDIPTRLDRADGDVHAAGNPHIQGDPRNIRDIAVALATRLALVDPAHAAAYASRSADFQRRWSAAISRWQATAASLKGTKIAVHHKSWAYLQDWLGLEEAGAIEPKPGVPPGSAYLAGLLEDLPKRQTRMILFAAYQDPKPARFVSERTGIPAVMLPFTVGGTDNASDLFSLFDDTIARLLAATDNKKP